MSDYKPRFRHILASIPNYDRSFGYLSSANPDDVKRAIFFVHGFAGNAATTWADFISLADDGLTSDWWQYSDLYFYDYHRASIHEQIPDNARDLFVFLKEMFPSPPEVVFRRPSQNLELRPVGYAYDEMYLVGHSEGGLLARLAVLRAAETDPDYKVRPPKPGLNPKGLLKAKLRLFAPAISGTIFTGVAGILARLPFIVTPAKQGLTHDSPPIKYARSETAKWIDHFPNEECFHAEILWAKRDWVVNKQKYPGDEECLKSPAGTKHTTICKPTIDFRQPVDFVEEGMNACDK